MSLAVLAGLALGGVALAGGPMGNIPDCVDVVADGWRAAPRAERVGLFKNTAWFWLRLYKVGASSGDGDRCGMHPSCSTYTWQAVERNGPVLGGWMGAARITANHRDPAMPLCREGDKLLRVDLPADAEFWKADP